MCCFMVVKRSICAEHQEHHIMKIELNNIAAGTGLTLTSVLSDRQHDKNRRHFKSSARRHTRRAHVINNRRTTTS